MPSDRGAGALPVNTAEILTEVNGIATAPGGLAERAEALLAEVRRVVRFDAGWIALLPSEQRSHVPLARSGYDERVCGYLDSPSVLADAELVGLSRSRRPIRGCDMPFPPSEVPGWAEYVEPAGFRDGVSVGLFTPEGHYLGLLALHTRDADQVSDPACHLLGLLATPIASAVDPLRSLSTIAGMVHRAAAGIVLAPSGVVLPLPGLPGLPDHRLLTPGSGVLVAAAAQLAEGGPHASFLVPVPDAEGARTHARITVLAVPPDLHLFASAIVLVSPAGDLRGLSHRELQVLGLLVTGASNEQIAGALGITARTVEVHVDHVRAKLSAPSRTAAAARALRLGLFVPSSLSVRA
ncbi:MAG TPA: LuxR C-terminal-related transcriptional regulator [Modestobacter sp.]|jgi:DNA-binding CsgD family transcriptional regulator|nr:LuxR C-terminal-related transcriptional regulator [Modestobacter sp.]